MKFKLVLLIFITGLFSCKTKQLVHASTPGNELYRVSILYANGEGKTFDMDYYERKHMPMVAGYLGSNLQFYEIDKGIAGRTPNDPVPYLAVGHFFVKNVADYNKAIAQNRETIIADFKNYTNIQPVILISEVRHIGLNNAK